MDHSIFLAKVFSVYLVVMAVAMLFNRKFLTEAAMDTVKQKGLSFLTAIFTLILGILLVLFHNKWTSNWTVIITILAWITLLKGIVRTIMPGYMEKLASMYNNGVFYYVISIIVLLLGVYLAYFGFYYY